MLSDPGDRGPLVTVLWDLGEIAKRVALPEAPWRRSGGWKSERDRWHPCGP